jgi:hypothetical protein
LAGPLGRSITQTRDADATRQSAFDGSLHEFGREERERDRHIDLSNAAFVARGNLLDTGDSAGDDLIKPTPAARDRCDERRAGFATSRSNWANDSRTLSVRRPIEVVVLNCWVTETNDTLWPSNNSTSLAKSADVAPLN